MCQKTYTNKGLGSSGLLDSGGHTWACARTVWQEGGSFLAHVGSPGISSGKLRAFPEGHRAGWGLRSTWLVALFPGIACDPLCPIDGGELLDADPQRNDVAPR